MLTSLLQQSNDLNHLETLQLYVVAADFKKMHARLKHPVSVLFLTCFQRVKSTSFTLIEKARTEPNDSDSEGNDQLFLDDIPILASFAQTKIPNLLKMAQAEKKKEPYKLYNKDTCMEFHELLCELLGRFQESLKDLKTLETKKEYRSESEITAIMDQLSAVLAFGRALRGIVRGAAITEHLKTIAHYVEVKAGKFWPMTHESELDPEVDAEFNLLKPFSTVGYGEPLQLWRSFLDWLRLMVHHFDAIHVLDNHLRNLDDESSSSSSSTSIEISIEILYPSLPDKKMLPWQEVLKNEKYFPRIQELDDQPSADDLITFLTSPTLEQNGNDIDELIEDIDAIKEKTSKSITGPVYADFTSDIEKITFAVTDLINFSSPGWKEYVVAISRDVNALASEDTQSRIVRLVAISDMLQNLKGSFLLFKKLQPDTPLSLGSGFSGAVHCEVSAALLNSLSGTTGLHEGLLVNVLKEYKVCHICVSSSNVCQTLQHRKPHHFSECLNDAARFVLACSPDWKHTTRSNFLQRGSTLRSRRAHYRSIFHRRLLTPWFWSLGLD